MTLTSGFDFLFDIIQLGIRSIGFTGKGYIFFQNATLFVDCAHYMKKLKTIIIIVYCM